MTRLVCCLCLLVFSALTHASELTRITARFPSVPSPPQGSVQWIAKSMRMNGVPMTLQSLRSKLSPEAVLHYYESWSKQQSSAQSVRTRIDREEALTIKVGDYLISIRAQRGASGTHGIITSSLASLKGNNRVTTAFPAPSHLRLVNLQEYEDEAGEAEHLSFVSTRAPHVETSALARSLEDAGWKLLHQRPMRETMRGYVIETQKGAQHAQLSILPSADLALGARILIVWKKS